MRPVALLFALAACKHAPPPTNLDASAASEPSASAAPSAEAIPAAWLACATDADCVTLPSACCDAWPSNVASRERVRAMITASDAARGTCADRLCPMRVLDAACDHGRCVVR